MNRRHFLASAGALVAVPLIGPVEAPFHSEFATARVKQFPWLWQAVTLDGVDQKYCVRAEAGRNGWIERYVRLPNGSLLSDPTGERTETEIVQGEVRIFLGPDTPKSVREAVANGYEVTE